MPDKDDVQLEMEVVHEEAKPWVRRFARFGYAANGFVYLLLGVLALRAAIGPRRANITREDVLVGLVVEPFGEILLGLITLGLVGYSLGHLFMAFRSEEDSDRDGLLGLGNRAAHGGSAFIHLGLALFAGQLALTGSSNAASGGQQTPEDWTALVMTYPFGRWLVGLAGLFILGVAFYVFYKAVTAKFKESFDLAEMSEKEKSRLVAIGRLGFAARGSVYVIIGIFVIRAAIQFDPQEVGGLGEALAALATQTYGPWLLGAVALGLMAYGLYGMLLGRYRDLDF